MDIEGTVLCGTNATGSLWCTYDITATTPVWVDIPNPSNQFLRSIDVSYYHFCGIFGSVSRQLICSESQLERTDNWFIVAVRNATEMSTIGYSIHVDDFAAEDQPELSDTFIIVLDRDGGPPRIAYSFNSTTVLKVVVVPSSDPAVDQVVLVLFWLVITLIPFFTLVYLGGNWYYEKYYQKGVPHKELEEEGTEIETAPMQDQPIR